VEQLNERSMVVHNYHASLEYIGATSAGLMQPLTLHEWDEMDRNEIDRIWDAWSVVQEVRAEDEEKELDALTGPPKRDLSTMDVEDTLSELMRTGME